jgi:hypothetical protein
MWEQLTPADIERVKQRLATERIETLSRHAEELKAVDADQAEIETFERLVAAFVNEHLSLPPTTTGSEEPTVAAVVGASATPEGRRNVPSPIQIVHPPSPNFGVPLRRFVRD